MKLLLVIIVIILYHTLASFLVDDGNSCNVLYIDKIEKLGLHQPDLSPCSDGSLIFFNYYVTHSRGMVDLPISLREGEGKKKITLYFLVISCKSAFSGLL